MNRTAELTSRFGSNMSESLGLRVAATPGEAGPKTIGLASPEDGRTRDRNAGFIELERVVPDPDQPRKTFSEESLQELAASIKSKGVLQSIIVRWSAELAKWVIVAGERRWRAAKLAGLQSINCRFVDKDASAVEIREDQLIENLQRVDLLPTETAIAYKELIELNAWTMQQLADRLNVSKATVSRSLALLKLPAEILRQVDQGQLAASAAYEVTKLDDAGKQRELADRIVSEGLGRDNAAEEAGRKSRTPLGAKLSTTKRWKVKGAQVSITWPKKNVRPKDVIEALEAALEQVRESAQADAA